MQQTPSQQTAAIETLTARDRCDACSARAYVKVEIPTGAGVPSDLLFCGHHFNRYRAKLETSASRIIDETVFISGGLAKMAPPTGRPVQPSAKRP